MIKRVFLITVDDLRADRLGCINDESTLTPNINSFAKDSVLFTNAFSTGPRTTLSFPSIIYGMYASEFFLKRGKHHFTNIAQVLKNYDFSTASFNSNPHFRLWGYQKGFDVFEDFLYETGEEREKTVEKVKKKVMGIVGDNEFLSKLLTKGLSYVSSDVALPYANGFETNKKCVEWVENQKNNSFFCWLHYMDPHYPFKPMKKYLDKSFSNKKIARLNRLHSLGEKYGEELKEEDRKELLKLYDAEVRLLDDAFGEFITRLKELDFYDDSLIIFTADHGELFGDYGFYGHRFDVLYQNQLHVPLLIKAPDNKHSVSSYPVSLIDVPFTLVDLSGADDTVFDGMNLLSDKRDFIYSEGLDWFIKSSLDESVDLDKIMVSCQNDQWKFIKDDVHQKRELFNLKKDVYEQNNVYNRHEAVYESFNWLIDKHVSIVKKSKGAERNKIADLKKAGKICVLLIILEGMKNYLFFLRNVLPL